MYVANLKYYIFIGYQKLIKIKNINSNEGEFIENYENKLKNLLNNLQFLIFRV